MTPPAVTGVLSRDGKSLKIVCPYCARRHVHGAAGGGGLRVAHCGGVESRSYVLLLPVASS